MDFNRHPLPTYHSELFKRIDNINYGRANSFQPTRNLLSHKLGASHNNPIGGFMWKFGFVTLLISLSLGSSAFCEEQTAGPKKFAYGFGMGQQAGDVSISLNVTSPYFSLSKKPCPRSWSAIRISGDYRVK